MGLSAGFAPGPLLALVISETLQHDIKSGIKVAFAPVITDIPIIILTLFILSRLSKFHDILGIISLIGGGFILFLGCKSIFTKGVRLDYNEIKPKSFIKGVLANILNPHPYLFWFSVGVPMINKALNRNITATLAFIISFYIFLVGSKIALALLVGKSKYFLNGSIYIYIMRFLGILLCILAFVLFYDGLKLLKAI
jgi:threonine/homoserine/homoserine lactone efflux protein